MNIFVSTLAKNLLRSISVEVKQRKKAGLDLRKQQDFSNQIEMQKCLAPHYTADEYQQAVQELCSCGLAKYYIRGGFILNTKGLYVAQHPIRFRLQSCRSEVIAVLALIISIATGWEELWKLFSTIVRAIAHVALQR